jgi:fructose-1,6-bisphosphatase/inositol monophosphatase family enzyme
VSPWLETCRGCVADIKLVLDRLPTRAEREPVLRLGEGGDDTTAIDDAAEQAVVARLEAVRGSFSSRRSSESGRSVTEAPFGSWSTRSTAQ